MFGEGIIQNTNVIAAMLLIDAMLAVICAYYTRELLKKIKINPKLGAITLFNQGRNIFMLMGLGAIIIAIFTLAAFYYSSNYFVYSFLTVFSVLPSGILIAYSLWRFNKIVESAY